MFSDDTVCNLRKQLDPFKDKLSTLYQWPIDKSLDKLCTIGVQHDICKSQNSFEKTLALRMLMQKKLTNTTLDQKLQKKLIGWIINDWGKIRSGKSGAETSDNEEVNGNESQNSKLKTLACLAKQSENGLKPGGTFKFDRIASWSKYLAFKYPTERAIYDARVIYSLNWLLLKCGSGTYFPDPKGRNTLMIGFDHTALILLKNMKSNCIKRVIDCDVTRRRITPNSKSNAMEKLRSTIFIADKLAYEAYCNLLKKIAGGLYKPSDCNALVKVEMILFAIADGEIVQDVVDTYSKFDVQAAFAGDLQRHEVFDSKCGE